MHLLSTIARLALITAVLVIHSPVRGNPVQERDTGKGKQYGTTPAQAIGFHGAQPVPQAASALQAQAGTQATGTLTLSGNANANETVVISTGTYTFASAITGTTTPGRVLTGTTTALTLANLAAAINGKVLGPGIGSTIQGPGITYSPGTPSFPALVTATTGTTTLVLTAVRAGTAANSIPTTETMTSGTFTSGATLTGGAEGTAAQDSVLLNEIRADLVAKGLIKGGQ